jgi:hypothetical protein
MTCWTVIPAALKNAWARLQNAVAVSLRSSAQISV